MLEIAKNNLSDIIDDLSNNVMFRLSLGSKELFHSNFWAWLLEEYKAKATPIFQENCNEDISEIYREMSHTDLSFKHNDKLIIIENKFKSYPDFEQLQRYAYENIGRNFDHIILVSYYEPTFLSNNGIQHIGDNLYKYEGIYKYKEENKQLCFQFKYLSYENILNNLKDFYAEVHPEHKTYVNDYIKMLQSLIELKEYLSMENNLNKTFLDFVKDIKVNEAKAKDFNFDVTIQKIFCNNLMISILRKLDTSLDKWGACNYASRARHVYMDIFLNTPNMGCMKDMGLQLVCKESENLRKYIHVSREKDEDIRNKIDIDEEYNWFFENTYGGKSKKFLGYEYEKDAWLYRTCNFSQYDISSLTFEKIFNLYQGVINEIEKNNRK